MSILIKGMSKPKTCDDCIVPLSKCDFLQRRADECPIVEIPTPHGRLIDKDELLSHLKKDPLFDLVERYGVSGVIESRPTILEAEE